MDETYITETTPDILPDDNIDGQTDELVPDNIIDAVPGTDTELMESTDSTESESTESVSMGDSTTYILTYSEEQQQVDSELIGGIN